MFSSFVVSALLLLSSCLSAHFFLNGLNGILVKIVGAINASTNNKSVEINFRREASMVFLGLVLLGVALVIIVIP